MPVAEQYSQFSHASYKRSMVWLYDLMPDAFWVSRPNNVLRANNKLLQMQVAHKHGMLIPKTLLSSKASEVMLFREDLGDIVAKPLYPEFVNDGGVIKVMYTTLITQDMELDLSGLHVSPALFQQLIKGTDIRVTVMGRQIFATEICKTAALAGEIDWRVAITNQSGLLYSPTTLPVSLESACFSVVRELDLVFGVFDFIRTSAGEYWFLEINPNGQWGFIELETGQPLSQAMASLFLSGNA